VTELNVVPISYDNPTFLVKYRWQGATYHALVTHDREAARRKLKELRDDKQDAWISS
jgi:hypothetical protein